MSMIEVIWVLNLYTCTCIYIYIYGSLKRNNENIKCACMYVSANASVK